MYVTTVTLQTRGCSVYGVWFVGGAWLTQAQIADRIRGKVDAYNEAFPSLLEIPSKDHPYDPEKDSVMKRVSKLFGE